VGGQGGGDRGHGPVAAGGGALGRVVGLELPLDPLVEGDQHAGGVGGGVDLDRPQRPGADLVEGWCLCLGEHRDPPCRVVVTDTVIVLLGGGRPRRPGDGSAATPAGAGPAAGLPPGA
jgi:hypothetical protein